MDKNLQQVIEKRIERTIKALRKNRFGAEFVKSKEDLAKKLEELIPEGASCSVGGSMTLFETGTIDQLKNGSYDYKDRYAQGIDPHAVFHEALNCDYYITSSNAVTEDGMLYNVDGNGNRLAALMYGPKQVIVVVGYNKIVEDLEAARARMRQITAPANNIRLEKSNPCTKTGVCMDCSSDSRICCFELTCKQQVVANRITVLILPGHFGY